MGFQNNHQIKTPTFNDLQARGIHLEMYYVQASCSPTRATIMTGRMPVHTGINVWIPNKVQHSAHCAVKPPRDAQADAMKPPA